MEAGWNVDLQELEYYPSKKDLTDAKIHHLLAEELCKPYKRVSSQLRLPEILTASASLCSSSVCRFIFLSLSRLVVNNAKRSGLTLKFQALPSTETDSPVSSPWF